MRDYISMQKMASLLWFSFQKGIIRNDYERAAGRNETFLYKYLNDRMIFLNDGPQKVTMNSKCMMNNYLNAFSVSKALTKMDKKTTSTSLHNPIALRMAWAPLSFGHCECNRVKTFSTRNSVLQKPLYSLNFAKLSLNS